MRVEVGEHAVDRAGDQILLVDGLDVGGADALEDVAEEVELLVDGGLLLGLLRDERPGELGADHRARDGSANSRHPDLLHWALFLSIVAAEQRFRIDRPPSLPDLYIQRFVRASPRFRHGCHAFFNVR